MVKEKSRVKTEQIKLDANRTGNEIYSFEYQSSKYRRTNNRRDGSLICYKDSYECLEVDFFKALSDHLEDFVTEKTSEVKDRLSKIPENANMIIVTDPAMNTTVKSFWCIYDE